MVLTLQVPAGDIPDALGVLQVVELAFRVGVPVELAAPQLALLRAVAVPPALTHVARLGGGRRRLGFEVGQAGTQVRLAERGQGHLVALQVDADRRPEADVRGVGALVTLAAALIGDGLVVEGVG